MKTVKERLLLYIAHLRISIRQFEILCDLSNGYVRNIVKSIPSDRLQKISSVFPDLDINWLMTGKGTMLKDADAPAVESYDKVRFVPLINLDARGGFAPNDAADVAQYTTTTLPFLEAHEGDFCTMVSGHSMAPLYPQGTILLLRPVEQWRDYLEYGVAYVIELTDYRRIVKIVRKNDDSSWLLISANSNYDAQTLPISMVNRVYQVKAIYRKEAL